MTDQPQVEKLVQPLPETSKKMPTIEARAKMEPVDQLGDLVGNPDFATQYVDTKTVPMRDNIQSIRHQIIDDKAKPQINEQALKILRELKANPNLMLEDARKLGKEWGQTIASIRKGIEANIEIEITQNPTEDILTAQQGLTNAESIGRQEITALQQEFELHKNDPALRDALQIWGITPDSKNSVAIDGSRLAFNAGVIHYFEYRTSVEKNGRFKESEQTPSIKGFIEFSKKMKTVINDPMNNPNTSSVKVGQDSEGKQRMYFLLKNEQTGRMDKVVAFKTSKKEPFRVITIFPGGDAKGIEKDFIKELSGDPNKETYLNKLGTERQEVVELSTVFPVKTATKSTL